MAGLTRQQALDAAEAVLSFQEQYLRDAAAPPRLSDFLHWLNEALARHTQWNAERLEALDQKYTEMRARMKKEGENATGTDDTDEEAT